MRIWYQIERDGNSIAGFMSSNTPKVDALNAVYRFCDATGWRLEKSEDDSSDILTCIIQSPPQVDVEASAQIWNAQLQAKGVKVRSSRRS